MKKIIAMLLIISSINANAISKSEKDCLAKMVYHEARSESLSDWLKVAAVARNRQRKKVRWIYGAKSYHLCDIVKSREFNSSNLVVKSVSDLATYRKIEQALANNDWQSSTDALFFKTVNGKMIYWR